MNINFDSLTCGHCGQHFDVEWMTCDPFEKDYWDAVEVGVINPMSDDCVTIFYATCDECGITDTYYSYEDAVKAAAAGKFHPLAN